MRPVHTFGNEILEKKRRKYRPALTHRDILQICHIAFERHPVFIPQRHGPIALTDPAAAFANMLIQVAGGRKHGRDLGAQRYQAGAGQRGQIDQNLRFISGTVAKCIGQNETTFGIGIQNLDGLAVHGRDHVAGFGSPTAGHVFGAGQKTDHPPG